MTNSASAASTNGRLVLCPTPLGNLEDVTLRALRELRECDVIFAEDTRVSQTLLRHYDIKKPLRSFHERVEASRLSELRALLQQGKRVAAITDAGTPGISDPGVELVRLARSVGGAVEALPGGSAVIAALILSGFDIGSFRFDGFAPRAAADRKRYFQTLQYERTAVVLFESPARIVELLEEIGSVLPQRRVFVLREYSKKFEQQLLGKASEVLQALEQPARGEFTLVVEAAKAAKSGAKSGGDIDAAIAFLRTLGVSTHDVAKALHLATGEPRNQLYRRALGGRA